MTLSAVLALVGGIGGSLALTATTSGRDNALTIIWCKCESAIVIVCLLCCIVCGMNAGGIPASAQTGAAQTIVLVVSGIVCVSWTFACASTCLDVFHGTLLELSWC